MELYIKQQELQNASYALLEERIEMLLSNKSSHNQSFAKAGGLLRYVQKFIESVEKFTLEYLQQVVGKVIQQENDYYAKMLGVGYKNIHDAVAKPLAWILFDEKRLDETVGAIQKSKGDFSSMEEAHLKRLIKEVLEALKKELTLGSGFYATLAEERNSTFKEMPQRVALAIWELGSNEIVNMAMVHLLSLQQSDNADDENSANSRQSFGGDIGESLHQRVAWRYLREIEKLQDENLKRGYRAYMNSNLDKFEQLSKALWSNKVELEVGQKLIDLAMEATVIKEYTKPNDEKNFNYLKLNPELLERMNESDKQIAHGASMIYKPMVIEPLEWKEMYGGGFLPDENREGRFDLSLIKASSKRDREALHGKEIPITVLNAVNHLQKTAFKVNSKMLEVLLDYHNDINYMKKKNRVDFAYYRILRELLSAELYNKSQEQIEAHFKKTKYIKVKDYELNQSDKKRIAKALKEIKKSNNPSDFKLDSEIYYEIAKYKQGFDTIVQIAKEMQKFEAFYFVWRMDFRGRLYPQQTLLNPQAGDMPKSLLLFAHEKPLNSEGKKWFYIHGANCYGEADKEVFSKRVVWVKEHHEEILASAKNYRKESFWKKAGDPFKFLAWAFEYARYVENPNTFTTGIPVAIDGSNNGFQHITALLKDVAGAKMVNVLPSYNEDELSMSDFYAEVARELKRMMQDEVESFNRKKESYQEKNELYYESKMLHEFEPNYHLGEFVEPLEAIDDLLNGQYFTTQLMRTKESPFKQNELDEIEKVIVQIERKVRNEVEENDIEEIRDSMIDEMERLDKRSKRELKRGKLILKKEKALKEKEQLQLIASSLYQKFLDEELINRSFVKGPVMTESYGSSTEGKAKALLEKIESSGILSNLEEKARYLVALEVTKLLEKALSSVSASPQKYKKWMKRYASDIVKTNNPILWQTPLGLEVEQVDFKSQKIKVSIDGGRKVEFKVYTDELDKSAHQKGLSPNYIHSLDASHLMMTVNALAQRGINDIVTVHDSFATHANDVGVLSLTLREAFVALHKKEILPELCQFWEEVFGVKQKKIPYVDKERFDLDEVLKSEYFFA
jgi:hypothetical protein